MVQVGSSVNQEHEGQDSQQDQPWTHLINDAVRDFVRAISDSSRQLAEAAERFAGESLSLIDDAASKAQSSAAVSGEMAEAARRAASEAQNAAESLQAAVTEAGEQIRNETRNSVDEALAQAREAQQASERAKADMQQQAEELIQRIERSSEGSQEVIRAAQNATDEVRQAAERVSETAIGVDTAVAAARDAADQARNAAERAERQAAEAAASASDTQQSLQEARGISARMEEQAGSVGSAIEAAQKAAEEASAAAGRIEEHVSEATAAVESSKRAALQAEQAADRASSTAVTFESTVVEVRSVAEQAREVVASIDATASDASAAASSAQQASQAAAEAAQRAEQAGSAPGLGKDADTLLERLENDYQLLTSLVQELATRISSMANVAAAQMDPSHVPTEAESWETHEEPALDSYESPIAYEATVEAETESPPVAEVSPEPAVESFEPQSVEEPPEFKPEWVDTTISYAAPAARETPSWQSESVSEPAPESASASFWHDVESAAVEAPLDSWVPIAESPAASPEMAPEPETPAWQEPVGGYQSAEPEAVEESPAVPVATSWQATQPAGAGEPAAAAGATLYGRVQVNLSPVPDFDRLLNLDSALSRISSVQTVTLADYAQEEVTFRIDLASPLDASDFAQQLSDAAGIHTEVAEADDTAVTLRLS